MPPNDQDRLRESIGDLVSGQLTSQKEFFERILQEQEKRYLGLFASRDSAVDAALRAAQSAVTAAFDANKEAIAKAETSQKDYIRQFRELFDAQAAVAQRSRDEMAQQISELRLSMSRGEGGISQAEKSQLRSQWTIGQAVTAGLALLAAVIAIASILMRK